MPRLAPRRLRLAAPVAVAGLIGLGAWLPTVTAGASAPNLPALTPAQLIAKTSQAHIDGLSGTILWKANLGLPDISGLTGGQGGSSSFNWTTLLSGDHTIKVWDAGARQQRLALPSTMAEVDFVRNGAQAWYYDSSTDKVTHLVPATGATTGGSQTDQPAAPAQPAEPALTPDQIAQKVLGHLSPSTQVSVDSPVYVGSSPSRAAYQLVVRPAAGTAGEASSTVSRITMAIDAQSFVPLQVTVDAKGAAAALQVGYQSVKFQAPAASEFAAPTGTSETTKTVGGHSGTTGDHGTGTGSKPAVAGPPWGQVATFGNVNLSAQARHQLSQVSTPVTWTSGAGQLSGQLVQTNLLNALILPDGRVLAGFVTPATLESTAGAGH
jgi:outer membrane lipoprotein-sorting protein